MSDENPQTVDPGAILAAAFEALPYDPAATTLDDLRLIAATSEGLTRQLERLRREHAELAARVLAGDADDDEDARSDAREELARLTVLGWGAELAHERLTRYADAALAAHGFNLVELLAGD